VLKVVDPTYTHNWAQCSKLFSKRGCVKRQLATPASSSDLNPPDIFCLTHGRQRSTYTRHAELNFRRGPLKKKTGVFKGPLWVEKITTAYFYWLQAEE
jgi:hypothetical protein